MQIFPFYFYIRGKLTFERVPEFEDNESNLTNSIETELYPFCVFKGRTCIEEINFVGATANIACLYTISRYILHDKIDPFFIEHSVCFICLLETNIGGFK